jgi:YD repeat-containing protein
MGTDMVTRDQIRWTPMATPRLEDTDVPLLSTFETPAYVVAQYIEKAETTKERRDYRDYRDLVIEDACIELEMKDERIASLEADIAIYRELTCVAFDALRDLTVSRDRDRQQHQYVRDEYRALRERLLLRAEADDPNGIAA